MEEPSQIKIEAWVQWAVNEILELKSQLKDAEESAFAAGWGAGIQRVLYLHHCGTKVTYANGDIEAPGFDTAFKLWKEQNAK